LDSGLISFLVVAVGVAASLIAVFLGLSRFPWRYGLIIGIGVITVVFAADFATRVSAAQTERLVFLAAIGGGLTVLGYERGKRKRDETIAAIVGPH
jgi:hypothetical protein